jgi:hypothetical protein
VLPEWLVVLQGFQCSVLLDLRFDG